MKKTIYIRVSTGRQTYDRQMYKMREYFTRMGMNIEDTEVVEEKITSHTEFTQRKIYPVLKEAQEGDIIYVCQLDRLGRTMVDILKLVDFAVQRGVSLITIDNGYQLENKSAMGKLYLGMVSAMAEAERELRAERCQAGVDAAREQIERDGFRITKAGKIQRRWGNPKGFDTSAASRARAESAQKALLEWKQTSKAFQWVARQVAKGTPRNVIIDEFNVLHEQLPEVYCTRQGKPLCKGVLSRWIASMNGLAVG